MAVPVIEGTPTTYSDIANSATRVILKPTGFTTGEWLVFWGGLDGNTSMSIDGGFTTKFARADGEYSSEGLLAVRKYTGTEGASFTVSTGSGSEQGQGVMFRLSGVDSGITATDLLDAISVCSADNTSSKITIPGFYCETDNALAVCAYISDGGIANTTGNGIPSGYTEIFQAAGLTAGVGISLCTKSVTSAGYVAPVEFGTTAASEAFVAIHFAIRSNTTIVSYPNQAILKATVVDVPASASSTVDVILQLPHGTVENDGLILEACGEVSGALNTLPSDFTQIDLSNTGAAIYSYAGKFVADASMPSSYSVIAVSTAAKAGALHRFINIDTSDFVHKNAVTTGTTDAAPTAPSVTTTADGCLVLRSYFADDDDGIVNGGYFASSNAIYSLISLANADISFQAAYSIKTTAGSTGTSAATLNASEEWVARTLAIRPAAGGNVSANLTGVSSTGSAGTVTVTADSNVTPTGVSTTGSAGTITATGTANVDLTGVESTGAAGDITVALNTPVDVAGVSSTGSAGTLDATGTANADLTGVEATGAAGDITVSLLLEVPLTGVESSGAAGTLDATGAANVDLSGVSSTGTAGTITATGDANVDLSGVSAAGEVGDITVDLTDSAMADLTGVSATGAAGDITVTANADVTLTGVEATGEAGILDADVSASVDADLEGVEAAGAAGTLDATGTSDAELTGVEATGQVGAISVTTTSTGQTVKSGAQRLKQAKMASDRRSEQTGDVYDARAELQKLRKNAPKSGLKPKVDEKSAKAPVKSPEQVVFDEPGAPIRHETPKDVVIERIAAGDIAIEQRRKHNKQKKQAAFAVAALLAEVERQTGLFW